MTQTLDTLGKCVRHGMVIQAECECGQRAFFLASDLAMIFGAGRDPSGLRFACQACRPKPPRVTVMEIDRDRLPKIMLRQPIYRDGLKLQGWALQRMK